MTKSKRIVIFDASVSTIPAKLYHQRKNFLKKRRRIVIQHIKVINGIIK